VAGFLTVMLFILTLPVPGVKFVENNSARKKYAK